MGDVTPVLRHWDYGPYEISSHADFWYRRDPATDEVQWYDDATFSWTTVPAKRWPYDG